jgi:predicted acyltransferase
MTSENRLASIDAFRGLAIAGMVIANFLAGVEWIPAWLKHAPDAGFTIIDLVAPMFIFAIGLTYADSARRRSDMDGAWKMTQHFLTRFFAILGIGALLSAGEIALGVDGQTINWGVLQAIGIAGLVTLVFIRTNTLTRLIAGVSLLALYQFLLQRFWLDAVLAAPHGGLFGSISWSAMLLLATVLADVFHNSKHQNRNLLLASIGTLMLALVLTLWFPISKNRVSAPYVLLSLGLSGLLFGACHLLVEQFKLRLQLLVLWGRNPLVMYVLHMLLLGIVYLPDDPFLYGQAPFWLVLLEGIIILSILTLIAWRLNKQERYVSL